MVDRPDLTVPVFARFNGVECRIGTLELPARGEPAVILNPELLGLVCRVAGVEGG